MTAVTAAACGPLLIASVRVPATAAGLQVVMGLVPATFVALAAFTAIDLSAFDAVVEVVEPLGSEILLNVSVGGQSVVCRVEPSVKARPHEKIRMAFVPERIHFFDTNTEAVVK